MLSRIETLKDQMRRSERKVADCVLARPHEVINDSIATLASKADVSEPTVMRFCRTIGCSGFQEFKLKLAQSLVSGVPYVHSGVAPDDGPQELITKIFESAAASLLRTRSQLDPQRVGQAVDLLSHVRRLEIWGHGASGIVALDAQHKFFRLGPPVVAYTDAHIHAMSAALLEPGDAIIAVSHSGRSKELVASTRLARESGAAVIAITAADSPLAQTATVTLSPAVEEDTGSYIPMSSRIVDLAIIDVLAVGVALRRGPELAQRLEKTKRILTEKHLL